MFDIRRLRPGDVISIALSPEKQDQQNVRKLKGMNDADWHQLVDLVHREGNAADGDTIKDLLRLESGQDAEMVAARANMTTIVRMLHDPSSQAMDMLLPALRDGKLCIIDVSQMRGTPALVLSGLILRRIFDHNQAEFTKAQPQTISVIAVVEEAQAVLGNGDSSGEGPYITWVKEGRKYDLGAVLITQQSGAISSEILSQGDNWFCFHLLSAGDLRAIKSANAHFSDDLLASLLLWLDVVAVLVDRAVMAATKQGEVRERGRAAFGPVAHVMPLAQREPAAREAATVVAVVKLFGLGRSHPGHRPHLGVRELAAGESLGQKR